MTAVRSRQPPPDDGPPTVPPRVSVVIPAWNEEARITRCIAAVLAQTRAVHEIIVVDNLSTDRTAARVLRMMVEHPDAPIRLLAQDDEQGLVPTRNVGLDAATGDIIGRIDADTMLEPTWCAQLVELMSSPAVDAATGPVSYYDMPFVSVSAGQRIDDRARRVLLGLGREYPFVFGSNMALRATAWRSIRSQCCTDEGDLMHEDIDVAIHLHRAGLTVAYCPELIASISARRLDTSPGQFSSYIARFDRTYRAHGIARWYLRAPRLVLALAYWPLHLARRWSVPSPFARGVATIGAVATLAGRRGTPARGSAAAPPTNGLRRAG
ncbi:glycosyltransferase [Marisediminicola senii]|uniref:glycosyltransferase n=1 Tax=Marisediminicola senii TaxID=2711233 RepID=UPI0013E9BBDD|nr:glycosyltransferase family 2 protein [Marisediminicola senii]